MDEKAPGIPCFKQRVCPENACLRHISEGQYAISVTQLQDIFDGGEDTAGVGNHEAVAIYLERIRREHAFFKAHGGS